jgi:uncharacterized protein YndB with AHSA1/START domain
MRLTRIQGQINASRDAVYRALLDPVAIAVWKVPRGMTCHVHTFDPRVGGKLRVSLTYTDQTASGKTSEHTDTYHGYFAELIPNQRVVEIDEFETEDPALRGEMKITIELTDQAGGTLVTGVHEGLPPGVPIKDNEMGWRMALERLANLLEETQH